MCVHLASASKARYIRDAQLFCDKGDNVVGEVQCRKKTHILVAVGKKEIQAVKLSQPKTPTINNSFLLRTLASTPKI